MSNKKTTIEILKKCISHLENMSQEEFDAIIKEKGIDKIVYNDNKYIDDTFHIIVDSETNQHIIEELESIFKDCRFVINRLNKGDYYETTISYSNKKYLRDNKFLDTILDVLAKYYSEEDLFHVAIIYDLLREYF